MCLEIELKSCNPRLFWGYEIMGIIIFFILLCFYFLALLRQIQITFVIRKNSLYMVNLDIN